MRVPAACSASGILALLCLAATPGLAQVSGVVTDAGTGLPLAGARVGRQATTIRTDTAPDGTFDLPGATGSSLTIVAAKPGYYNSSVLVNAPASGVAIALQAVPADSDSTYAFIPPTTCAICHPDQYTQWDDSPMRHGGENTWVYDLYDGTGTPGGTGGFVYTRDSIHSTANPESECAACHQPEPWIKQPFRALEPIDSLSTGAMHGISCETCHKIAHLDESKTNFPGIWPGVVTFTRPSSSTNQVEYGALGDADYVASGIMRPSWQPQMTAAICAACHQDKNDPDLDGDFEEANGVISEPTYVEWLDSPYGDPQSSSYATCVDCHMPAYGSDAACAVGGPVRDPDTVRSHRIVGTTPEFLENAVSLDIQCSVGATEVEAVVTITNDGVGHHVPTGVTVRNMILLVEAWREQDGQPLEHTGSQLVSALGGVGSPAQGYYAGLPGKLFAKVNHDSGGSGPVFFTEAAGIQIDNRIPALGSDQTTYTFAIPEGGGTLRVRARLIYRRAWRAVVDAKGWTQDGHGNPLEDVLAPHFGHLMEQAEWSADVTGVDGIAASAGPMALYPCRPNPAGPTTPAEISFRMPARARASLAVYDAAGRRVAVLLDGVRDPGLHRVVWDGRDAGGKAAASGVYLYRLDVPGAPPLARRLVLLR